MSSRLLLPLACLLACGDPAPEADPHAATWAARHQAGTAALEQGEFAAAQRAFDQALAAADRFPAGDDRYGRTLLALADLYTVQGDLSRAESLYVRLRQLQAADPDDPANAHTLGQLAEIYRLQKRLPEAEALFSQVLSSQQARADDDAAVAATQQKLADLYLALGDRPKADSLAQHAHARLLRAQAHGDFIQGKYAKAEPLLQSALARQEQYFGAEHPALARTCYYLGRLYDAQDQSRKAEHFYRRALAADPADPDRAREALDALLTR